MTDFTVHFKVTQLGTSLVFLLKVAFLLYFPLLLLCGFSSFQTQTSQVIFTLFFLSGASIRPPRVSNLRRV